MERRAESADRRQQPGLRRFIRFEFIAYILLHAYTCYVILTDYGLIFALIAAICPVIPEIYLFVIGLYAKEFIYVSVFLIFVALVVVNAVLFNRRDRGK